MTTVIMVPLEESVKPAPSGPAPTELTIEDIVVGDGAEAVPGSTVEVMTRARYAEHLPAGRRTALYDALKKAGVPVELHIFERGGHGTGMAQGFKNWPELAIYPTLLANWVEMHGWMTRD